MISFPDDDGVVVILQVTNRCQLHCSYCEYPKTGPDLPRDLVARMITDTMRLVPRNKSLSYVWHGGEPMLLGVDYFRWVRKVQEGAAEGRTFRNILQTNGLLLNGPMFEFIQETGDFMPNISMDGPTPLASQTRGVDSSRYEELFDELDRRGLPYGIAVVGSPLALQHRAAVLKYFQERGRASVGITVFHNFTACGAAPPDPNLVADLALGPGYVPGEPPDLLGGLIISGIQHQMLTGACRLSSFSGGCHRRLISVDSRGELFTCPRGRLAGLWTYGNVATGGLETWWRSTQGPAPFRPRLPEACGPCRWAGLCQGGCPANAQGMNGGAENPDLYCASFQRLFEVAAEGLGGSHAVAVLEQIRMGSVENPGPVCPPI